MAGAQRQFVHFPENGQRLAELALLAGSILSMLAATFTLAPTGFWDRQPKRTRGASTACYWASHFPKMAHFQGNFAKSVQSPHICPKKS